MSSNYLKSFVLILLNLFSFVSIAETLVSVKYTTGVNPKQYKVGSEAVFLELGDAVKSLIIDGKGKYKVYLQTETSVTIMNEGPHQDLTNWKHGKSRLLELVSEKNEFHFVDQNKSVVFPKVELSELVDEARRVGGHRWAEIAKKCKSPQEYPCGVGPSKYIFKIKKEVKGKWLDEGDFVLIPPMGC